MISIENTINQHIEQVEALDIPSLLEFDPGQFITTSPYIYKYRLNSIKNDVISSKLLLATANVSQKLANELSHKLDYLLSDLIDEKMFVVNKLIEQFNLQCSPKISDENDEQEDEANATKPTVDASNDEDFSQLRKRLLSGGTATILDENNKNDYHDDLQSDLLQDLTDLTSTLKNGALNLSQKILGDDLNILNETNENIIKNSSLFKVIDKNLSGYLQNKTGGKISLFWLLKVTAALVVGFLFMVLIIKIVPQIG